MMEEATQMTSTEQARKLAELDRLLNDPDVPMDPMRVWSLLEETKALPSWRVDRGS